MARDFYDVLGVKRNASAGDLKKAYRRLAKQYHPDTNGQSARAAARFKEVNEAYDTLSDPEKRQQYDLFGRAGGGPQGFQDIPVDFSNFNFSNSGPFGDFIDELFKGQSRQKSSARQRRPHPRTGQDIEHPLAISLAEAYHGATRMVRSGEKEFRVRIPRGIRDGTRIRVSGKGGPGAHGGKAGDLYLRVSVAADQRFQRQGEDLLTDLRIDLFTALLGGVVEVPTMERPLRLTIPPGTDSGQRFRLTGKGMPRSQNDDARGDLFVRVEIETPGELSADERAIARSLRDSIQQRRKTQPGREAR